MKLQHLFKHHLWEKEVFILCVFDTTDLRAAGIEH